MDIQGKPSGQPIDSAKSNASSSIKESGSAVKTVASASQSAPNLLDSGLKLGESYLATVTQKLTSEMREGQQVQMQRVLLTTANTTLSVLTDIPLEEGELVTVKVADNYTLKLSPVITDNNLPSAQKLATLIARILPYQSSVATGVASAMKFGQQLANTTPENAASATLLKNIDTLLKQLPDIRQLAKELDQFTQTLLTTKFGQNNISTLLAIPTNSSTELSVGDLLKNLARTVSQLSAMATSESLRQAASSLAQAPAQTMLKLISPELAARLSTTTAAPTSPHNQPANTATADMQTATVGKGSNPLSSIVPVSNINELLAVKLTAFDVKVLSASKNLASAIATVQNVLAKAAAPANSQTNYQQVTTASAPTTTNNNNSNPLPPSSDSSPSGPAKEIRAWLQTNMMKSHLNASGIGFESRLARSPQTTTELPTFTQDIKSSLIRLVSQLAPDHLKPQGHITNPAKIPTAITPDLLQAPFDYPRAHSAANSGATATAELSAGELLKQIAGALNRIQFNQLNSLHQTQSATTDTMNVQTWMIDMPFIVAQDKTQTVQIKIEQYREKHKNKQRDNDHLKRQWKVTLGFDFEAMGTMQIQVRCLNDKLSSTIWAERVDTLKLLNDEVPRFRQQLLSLGLEVETIECKRGRVSEKQNVISHNLVDIHT